MAAADQLSAIMNVINGIKGNTTTTKSSGGTQTTQANVSDAGVSELLKQILSGSGGVKDIGARARASGLYNSTTEGMLLDNLYSSAAAKTELARTPTVTTTTPQTQTSTTKGAGLGDIALGLGGAFAASQALNLGSKLLSPVIESGTNSIGSAISDLLGLSGGSTGTSGNKNSILDGVDFGGYGSFGGNVASSGNGFSAGEGYALNTSTLGNFSGGSSTFEGAKGLNFGMDLDSGQGSVGVGGLGAIGGLVGSALSGLFGGGGGSSGGSSGGGSSGGSVICTALKDRGLLDRKLHAAGEAYLNALPLEVKLGYQSWAISIADKISEGHKGWTKVCTPVARSRTSLLATRGTFIDHIKHPLGTITKFIGEPICGLIGKKVLANPNKFHGV